MTLLVWELLQLVFKRGTVARPLDWFTAVVNHRRLLIPVPQHNIVRCLICVSHEAVNQIIDRSKACILVLKAERLHWVV